MKYITTEEARKKIHRYCAYQERSHQQVEEKLYTFGVPSAQAQEIVAELIIEGFLNEERFARAFAGGKFRIKRWGRLKIVRELQQQNVSKNCIRLALQEIESDEYNRTLKQVLQRKLESLEISNLFIKRDKAARYAIGKGFEPDLVWTELKELLPD